jgi:aspartate-semialdehyde dehydrogenase
MEELLQGTRAHLDETPIESKVFAHPLAFNVIPHIDEFLDNLYTREEMKVTHEMRKIFQLPRLALSCTAVRTPTLRAHAESITLEMDSPVDLEEARRVLREAPGVSFADAPLERLYPMPLTATRKEDVEVGRLRPNRLVFGDYGLDLFVCGDQLLRGAALNAVLIAEASLNPPSVSRATRRSLWRRARGSLPCVSWGGVATFLSGIVVASLLMRNNSIRI